MTKPSAAVALRRLSEDDPVSEPIKRLSIDMLESVHRRFLLACVAADKVMTDEVLAFIERRTAELNQEAAARFAAAADAEGVDFGEFFEKVLDAYERAKER
jgi:hypothetical protein